MAQHSFIRVSGGSLIPATPDTQRWLTERVKPGAVVYADFKQARNPAFHRKFSHFSTWALITGIRPRLFSCGARTGSRLR